MADDRPKSEMVASRHTGSKSILLYCNWGVFIDENDTVFIPSVHFRYLIALKRLGYDRIDLMTKVAPIRTISCDTQISLDNIEIVRLPWFKNYLGAAEHFCALMRAFLKATRKSYDRVYIRVFEPFAWLLTVLFFIQNRDFTQHNVIMHFVFDPLGVISSNSNKSRLRKIFLYSLFLPEYWLILTSTRLCKPTCNGPTIRQSFPKFVARRMVETIESALLDEDIPREKPFRATKTNIRLLYVGYLRPSKGIDVLLSAILQVRNAGVADFELRIVGSGSYHSHIQNFIKQHGLETIIQLAGHVSFSEKLFSEYRQADIFINPSPSETGPRVLLEAKVFGNRLISTDVGYARTVIDNACDGEIIPKNDTDALAKAIVRAINLERSKPRNALSRQQRFTHNVTVEEFFHEVLDEA